jgi:hypothetical protein
VGDLNFDLDEIAPCVQALDVNRCLIGQLSLKLTDSSNGVAPCGGLERVTLHACRHLYASMSIAAGVNAHALCTYMGHSGIQVTYDLYGHLFPGNEAEASALLDRYLERVFVAV